MELQKISFAELNKKTKKQFVLFGSGNIAKKVIRKLGKKRCAYIVDNSVKLQGLEYEGLQIKSPNELDSSYYVIICSTAISHISEQLIGMDLHPNNDFTICPLLNDLLAISELESLETSFYFTSGTISHEADQYGGGLYRCDVKGLEVKIEKIYNGPCYGALKYNGGILFIDTDKGVFEYNENEGVQHRTSMPKGARAHGISRHPESGYFYLTCSNLDVVFELDDNFKILRTIKLSNKIEFQKEAMHHCNDNYVIGNSLFVSMFSSSGNWKLDKFDGCIAEFDLSSGARLADVQSDLYMPHNVMVFDGALHVLDSLPGHLRFGNLSVQGTFPAFTRGLNYCNGLYYIGQSKNRNYSRVLGVSNNISIDCGVIVFNSELKVSRFLQFPYTIGEIHSIAF